MKPKSKLLKPFENSLENIRLFKKNSIFYYYCKLFLIVFLIPFFIFNTVMISYYYKNMSLRTEISARNNFNFASNAIHSIVEETSRVYLNVIQAPITMDFMTVNDVSALSTRMKELMALDETIDNYSEVSASISSVTVYSKGCQYVLSRGANGPVDSFTSKEWYKNTNPDLPYYYLSKPGGNGFYICYNVFSSHTSIGLVVFDISLNDILPSGADDASLVLSDANKNIFWSVGEFDKSRFMYASSPELCVNSNLNKFFISSFQDEIYINMRITEPATYIFDMLFYVLLCLVITIAISLILAVIVSIKSYSSIDKILLEIGEISESGTSSDENLNEVSFITSQIMGIRNKNTSLEEELTTSAYALKKMQIEALQMQFNPHFLFNALNSLSMRLTKENGINSPYSSLIVLLSDILCESLNTAHYMVRIEDEIEYAKKYLDFQKLADSCFFDTEWDIDSRVLGCYTVKLSMQPLIENAVKHGIKSLRNEEKGIIRIRIKKDGSNIVFTISNNCKEIDRNAISFVKSSLENGEMPSSKNIGLKNVNKRIQLIFGEDYGCAVSWEDNIFTVRMTVPAVDKL